MPPGFERSLAHAGFRVTRQRRAVYEFLRDARSHPTVEQVLAGVRARAPLISLNTVYTSLQTLVSSGVVVRLEGELAGHYDARVAPHCHLRCSRCGAVSDVDLPQSVEAFLAGLDVPGFQSVRALLSFSGICPLCQR
ncbi:MAG: transcriptional repressor [Acidobacteria bacterium]|nr:transcriptional repressor [Acidobacteriota bacterium]